MRVAETSMFEVRAPETWMLCPKIKSFVNGLLASVVKPFLANIPILYSLKTPENRWFSGVFRGHEMGTLVRNGLIIYF